MDAATVAVSIGSALVSGGVFGGLVSLIVARRESRDRREALGFEREKHRQAVLAERRREFGDLYQRTHVQLRAVLDVLTVPDTESRPAPPLNPYADCVLALRDEWLRGHMPQIAQALWGVADRLNLLKAWRSMGRQRIRVTTDMLTYERLARDACLQAMEVLDATYLDVPDPKPVGLGT